MDEVVSCAYAAALTWASLFFPRNRVSIHIEAKLLSNDLGAAVMANPNIHDRAKDKSCPLSPAKCHLIVETTVVRKLVIYPDGRTRSAPFPSDRGKSSSAPGAPA